MAMLTRVRSLDATGAAVYRDLKDRVLAREHGQFIAEGLLAVGRLLASPLEVESVLISEKALPRLLGECGHLFGQRSDLPILVASSGEVDRLVGFAHHAGVLACGKRPEPLDVDGLLAAAGELVTLLVATEITNHENLGALIRTAAGFGCVAILLGERCCDPFYRRCVRVSMGAVFRLPVVRCDDLRGLLSGLAERWGLHRVATVCQADAVSLAEVPRPKSPAADRVALLVGEEARGLHRYWHPVCDAFVTIPMAPDTDSLNVNAAAAVALYHFTQVASTVSSH